MSTGAADGIRVLHVDDDPDVADLTATYLERDDERITVETASDASEGVERLTAEEFDCVVSDYDMPGRTGIEFLETVRADHPELPFILFTGKGSEAVASEAISAGVTDYLQKETGTNQYTVLANRITNAVEHRRTREQVERGERRLREIVDALQDLLYVVDEDGTYLLVNESLASFHDATVSEIEDATVDEVLGERLAAQFREDLAAVIETDSPKYLPTVEIPTEEGERHVFEPRMFPFDFAATDKDAVLGVSFDVTEREARKRERDRTNALLSTLFDTLPVGVLAEDASREVLAANQQLIDLFGLPETPEEIVGEDCVSLAEGVSDLFDEPDRFVERIDELVAERNPVRDEHFALDDGRTFTRSHEPIELTDGEGHLWVYRDVTGQEQREEKLNRLQAHTRALMNSETRDETARIAARAAEEVFDAPLSTVHLLNDVGDRLEPAAVSDSVRDVFDELPVYPRAAPDGSRASLVWEVYESGQSLSIDDVAKSDLVAESTPAQSVVLHPMDDHGVFVLSSDEREAVSETDEALVEILANTLTSALDRVERTRQRRQRQRSLERLQDASLDLMQARDEQAIADLVVTAAEDILGFPLVSVRSYDPEANGLVPLALSEQVGAVLGDRPTFTPGMDSLTLEAFDAGESRVVDDFARTGKGVDEDAPIRSLIVFPLGEFGTLTAASAEPATFDETDVFLGQILASAANAAFERAENETERRRQRAALEEKNERLEEFTRVVSHDLRNPLTVLRAGLELAEESGEPEHFERAYRALDRMERMIEDLLTLSKQGETIAEPQAVDLANVATACAESVGAGDGQLSVEADRPVLADPDRLRQLVENLLRNALEHGGPDVSITVGDLSDGFYVADDGPGVPADVRDQVFDSGFSTATENTGFGLAIVDRIAEAHGWSVGVGEREGGGARFEISGVDRPPSDR